MSSTQTLMMVQNRDLLKESNKKVNTYCVLLNTYEKLLRTYERPIISDHEYAKLNVNQNKNNSVFYKFARSQVDHKVKQMELQCISKSVTENPLEFPLKNLLI